MKITTIQAYRLARFHENFAYKNGTYYLLMLLPKITQTDALLSPLSFQNFSASGCRRRQRNADVRRIERSGRIVRITGLQALKQSLLALNGEDDIPTAPEPTLTRERCQKADEIYTPWGVGLRCMDRARFQAYGPSGWECLGDRRSIWTKYPEIYMERWQASVSLGNISFLDVYNKLMDNSSFDQVRNMTEEQRQLEEKWKKFWIQSEISFWERWTTSIGEAFGDVAGWFTSVPGFLTKLIGFEPAKWVMIVAWAVFGLLLMAFAVWLIVKLKIFKCCSCLLRCTTSCCRRTRARASRVRESIALQSLHELLRRK